MSAGRYSPRSSHDSDDSLRALELTEGPLGGYSAGLHGSGTHPPRSYSVSGFQFESDLFQLTSTLDDPGKEESGELGGEKRIGFMKGVALCVGSQVGSGIFSSPGIVIANAQSVGASLTVWVAAGILAWTGASSFAELGASIPVNGGTQAYLAYAYGPLISYLYTWTSITLKPGANAVIGLIFAEYTNRLLFHTTSADVSPDSIPQWAIRVTAIISVLLVTTLCVATPSLGTHAAVVFTTVKVCALGLVCILGIIHIARGKASTSLTEPLFANSSTSPTSYALAFYSGLWAFDGWDQANYVGGEVKDPQKNLPRVIHFSMFLVMILFSFTNVAYFAVLDKDTVARSNTVALDFGRALFGPFGGAFFAVVVAISCLGAMNGSFFTAARLIYVAGKEGYLPSLFGTLNPRLKTPLNAMLLQAVVTIAFICFGDGFRSLINFAVILSWLAYFLTVLGLVVLRIKEPSLERPYKTWIITPLIFCAVALFLLCMPVLAAPLQSLGVIGFVSLGIPVYYITQSNGDMPRIFDFFGRFRSRPDVGSGWQAVATEEVEMSQSRQ
ncbi:L-methionine transporter [Thelephora ganbajun]|uniref:L-methionine transporter n=1 Tax=Thelephora ganbajun TaxID=370292 RepID=A0ACB6Z3F2_THEGA|nr:L-methionine transporter [Thelephora ganbajun]